MELGRNSGGGRSLIFILSDTETSILFTLKIKLSSSFLDDCSPIFVGLPVDIN